MTGMEFRESTALISPKCDVKVVPNMVFIVYVGLQGWKNPAAKDEQSKTSAVLLSDTVLISAVSKFCIGNMKLLFKLC